MILLNGNNGILYYFLFSNLSTHKFQLQLPNWWTPCTFLSFEWNSISLGSRVHGIVTKTVHKTLPGGGGGLGGGGSMGSKSRGGDLGDSEDLGDSGGPGGEGGGSRGQVQGLMGVGAQSMLKGQMVGYKSPSIGLDKYCMFT